MKHFVVISLVTLSLISLRAQAEEKPAAPPKSPAPAAAPAKAPAAAPAAVPATAVARVNGEVISQSDLDSALKGLEMQFQQQGRALPADQLPQIKRKVLDEMISRELLLQEARQKKVPDLDAKVDAEIAKLKQQVGGDQQFTDTLREAGFTVGQYRKQVQDNVLVQEMLRTMTLAIPEVGETEAQEFYKTNQERFKHPQLAHVRHILIRVPPNSTDVERQAKRATIDALRTRIDKGEDFAEVARKNSEDPGSAIKGGDLGTFQPGMMVPEFDAVSFSLEPGKLSDVVTTQFGFHILQVIDRKPAGEAPFAEVKDRIREGLRQQKAGEAARKHVEELRTTAKVEILLDQKP